MGLIYSEVYKTIQDLYKQGFTTYLSGMNNGFDMISAEAVLALKDEGYNIKLIAVVPFMGQELRYNDEDKARYTKIFDKADDIALTSDYYYNGCYLKRNDYLIENSSMVVCYYSGIHGGTMYTMNRAKKVGLPFVNVFTTIRLIERVETSN